MAESADFFREFANRFAGFHPDVRRLAGEGPPSPTRLDQLFGPPGAAWLAPEKGNASRFEVRQLTFPGSVRYIVVSRRQTTTPSPAAVNARSSPTNDALREWLWPAPQLPPTDLVYDATEELLHGKAKPILCDLTRYPIRLFALLPTQLERVLLRAQRRAALGGLLRWDAGGADASDRAIAGRLPFAVSLFDPAGRSTVERFLCASPEGVLRGELPLAKDATPGAWTLRVRSQLNGLESSLRVDVVPADASASVDAAGGLSSDGAESRWAPRPIVP